MSSSRSQFKYVKVAVDERRWRALASEAELLTQVFGMPVAPEGVLQARVDNYLQSREVKGR